MLDWDDEETSTKVEDGVDPALASSRVKAVDKRIINGGGDVNQLVPFKYKWAWEYYLAGTENAWMPAEMNIDFDREAWRALSESDILAVKRAFYPYLVNDVLGSQNYILAIYRHVTAPECRQYYLRQSFERSVSGTAIIHMAQTYGLDIEASLVDEAITDPIQTRRNRHAVRFMERISDPTFFTGKPQDDIDFFVCFVCLCFGHQYLSKITSIRRMMDLARARKLNGLYGTFEKMLRDEQLQLKMSTSMTRTIMAENSGHINWQNTAENGPMRRVVDGLMGWYLIEVDYIKTQFEPCDHNHYLEALRSDFQMVCSQIGIAITI